MLGFWLNIPKIMENTRKIYIATGRDIFLAFLGPSRQIPFRTSVISTIDSFQILSSLSVILPFDAYGLMYITDNLVQINRRKYEKLNRKFLCQFRIYGFWNVLETKEPAALKIKIKPKHRY